MKPYSSESWSDPTAWVELRQLLNTAREELGNYGLVPPSMPLETIRKSVGEARRQLLEASYRPHEEAVSQAMQQRFGKGVWPNLSPVRAHYASVILRYASIFVCHVCMETDSGGYSTIFPFPDLPVQDVALYLASRWWHEVGWIDYAHDFENRIEPVA